MVVLLGRAKPQLEPVKKVLLTIAKFKTNLIKFLSGELWNKKTHLSKNYFGHS